jgi:hypothetical protein
MLTIDCNDVVSIKNELLVYVADQMVAIPTLKNNQFTLSTLNDDEILDTSLVISAIKEFLDSIGEGRNFAVIASNNMVKIASVSGKIIERDNQNHYEMFSCPHCGFVTQYEVELGAHMKIHYL